MTTELTTDILVVGGGTGGTAAAIQAARMGVETILVSEFAWLGGMLTSAGVSAPDGNELVALQTGLWGAYLKALRQRQPGGLDHGWVSLFTYDPRLGAQILSEWVKELPNLTWIRGQKPLQVLGNGNRITGVRFADYLIEAKITLDGTELGDLLALGEVPHRWGWELQEEFNEPSAPVAFDEFTDRYPVQVPTWVFILQDYGESNLSPEILPSPLSTPASAFEGAWDNYGGQQFLNYGRLPEGRFMINWPICGNDYGESLGRLVESATSQQQFLQEAYYYSQNFAHFIQKNLGRRYGLAPQIFPHSLGNGAFALHPYYRESRRLQGQITVTERDILPVSSGFTMNPTAIAIGNYANDHHYPGVEFSLQPKSMVWGGRWTGTPFSISYGALVPIAVEGLLLCEKNISVSHIANGCTRLQPVVMNIGQAAGMAGALCVKLNCQPGELPVRRIQEELLTDSIASAAVIPLLNLPPEHPDWLKWQRYYLDHPEDYPSDGNCPNLKLAIGGQVGNSYVGIFEKHEYQKYSIILTEPEEQKDQVWSLITVRPEVNQQLQELANGQSVAFYGSCNTSGGWLLVEFIDC